MELYKLESVDDFFYDEDELLLTEPSLKGIETIETVMNSCFDELLDAKIDQENHPNFDFLKWIATHDIEYEIKYFEYYPHSKEITLDEDDIYWYWKIISLVLGEFDEYFWNTKTIQSLHDKLKNNKYYVNRNYYDRCDVYRNYRCFETEKLV